jgi:acyl carrier protein
MIDPEALKDLFVDYLGVDGAFVDLSSTFDEDLDMSDEESEGLRRLIESELGLSILTEDWNQLNSLEDILEYEREQEM